MLTPNSRAPTRLPPDRRKPASSHARAVGSYIPKLAAKAFEKYGFHSAEIMTSWTSVAGEELAAVTAPDRLKWPRAAGAAAAEGIPASGATLILRVEAAHALEIQYRSGEIIDRINRYFGYRAVTNLKFVQATNLRPAQRGAAFEALALPAAPPPIDFAPDTVGAALAALWSSIATAARGR